MIVLLSGGDFDLLDRPKTIQQREVYGVPALTAPSLIKRLLLYSHRR
jgi:hypothetical protein